MRDGVFLLLLTPVVVYAMIGINSDIVFGWNQAAH